MVIEVIGMEKIFQQQQRFFLTDKTKSYAFRERELKRLLDVLIANEALFQEALVKDLNKSSFELYATEIGIVIASIRNTLKKLKSWMKVRKVKTPLYQFGSKSYIQYEPLGTVLIIGPYNYPIQLVIEPLIGALAAGNTVILKPSEFASHTEKALEKVLNKAFDSRVLHVVTGGVETTQKLLSLKFDHIFFTGSTRVGQIVYEAAAKHLIPVTLELGGKSPTIVDETAKISVAAKRIVFGKFINAGQTCIAPDYLYVHAAVKDQLIEMLIETIDEFYNNHETQYGRIINDKHYQRLTKLILKDNVIYGGNSDSKTRYIEPTLLDNITWEDAVMQEEIFGPILPIMTFNNLEEVITTLKQKEKPLALYLFTENKSVVNNVFNSLSFGGGAINDTIMHVANPNLPFGGVGHSGMGVYHGVASFKTFSHAKSYIKKSTKIDPKIAYPPYTEKQEKLVRKVLK